MESDTSRPLPGRCITCLPLILLLILVAAPVRAQCPGPGSCCEPNGTPGCDDAPCCSLVCAADAFCCQTEWDLACVAEAFDVCKDLCPPPPNDLCADAISVPIPSTTVGSTATATADGAGLCGPLNTGAGVWYSVVGTGNAVTASTCTDFASFDTRISVFCGGCDELTCVAGNDNECRDGASFLLSTVTWCSEAGVEYLVLVHGPFFASGSFILEIADDGDPCEPTVGCGAAGPIGACCHADGSCSAGPLEDCDAAGGVFQGNGTTCAGNDCDDVGCGSPAAGSCCRANGSPYCDDADCCLLICAQDLFCCLSDWDETCASSASVLCEVCGGSPPCSPGTGCCYTAHDTPGCGTAECCELICDLDAFCCEEQWDGKCVELALAECRGACPGDTNDDLAVDVLDLTNVILAWGSDDANADVNGDCLVTVVDLTGVITGWGACPVGACCLPSTSCLEEIAEQACLAANGVYQGDGSTCSDIDCPGPENDECADSIEIVDGSVPFTTFGATTDLGPPSCGSLGSDIWFHYTPTIDALLTVDTCGSSLDTVLAIYEGADCASLRQLDCNDDTLTCYPQSRVVCLVSAGQSYKIRVGGSQGAEGDGMLNVTAEEVAGIGACCYADRTCLPATAAGCLGGGGTYQGDGTTCEIVFCDDGISTCCEPGGKPGCDDRECEAAVCAEDPFCCEVGWDKICVDQAQDLCDGLCVPLGPVNDLCATSSQIVASVTEFSNIGAGTDVAVACAPIGADIWFDYTTASAGVAVIATCGSFFDTVLVVYEGCNCLDPIEVSCNDDACGLTSKTAWFALSEGQCYKIRVGGYDGAQGSGVLVLNVVSGTGDCCSPQSTAGCSEPQCAAAVCTIDEFCCLDSWDDQCAEQAARICPQLCGN